MHMNMCIYMRVVSLYLSATETTCHSTILLGQPTIGEYAKDRQVSRVMDASCLPQHDEVRGQNSTDLFKMFLVAAESSKGRKDETREERRLLDFTLQRYQ